MTSTPIRCVSPIDGSVYVEREAANELAIQQALELAAEAQRRWQEKPLPERARCCAAAVEAMLAKRDVLVPELAWQMGRPVRYGGGELRGFAERADYMIAIAEEALRDLELAPLEGFRRYIRREPLGTVLVIAPWNYPYLTAVNSVIPALMAGNVVIHKASSQTLLVGERFQQAFQQAELPAGVFQNLVLTHPQTAEIIGSGKIQQVNFTGSVAAGQAMERAAAGKFLGLGLELGGKDAALVRRDCDLSHAVQNLAEGAFFNSGQSCCGIERIYVHAEVLVPFLDGIVREAVQLRLGNPLDQQTTLGPMVRPEAADWVRRQTAEAVAAGATPHVAADAFSEDQPGSAYLGPQVLTGVDHRMSVMNEESFGPVVGIMPVQDDAEAIRLMNDSRYGLTAAIWTQDAEAAAAIGHELETGTVFMNRCDYLDPALAWTGVKQSGRGVTLSRVGYENLTRPKSFHFRCRTKP